MHDSTKKRVLVVDDAVVVRKALADAISLDPALEVCGTAPNGRIALAKFSSLKPDMVLLDIDMPEMDGLETVRELRRLGTTVPIIIFSTLTERGVSATLEALSLGATDYVTKAGNVDTLATSEAVSRELVPRIRALCGLPELALASLPEEVVKFPASKARPIHRAALPVTPHVIAIGVSTGGPDALATLLPSLPAGLGVPIVIAQHMPPTFTSLLAVRLSAKSAIPVRECQSGELLTPGCVFIAPGDFHMVVENREGIIRLRTHRGDKENFCRPSVDVLFRSVAEAYGPRALAVVLTGMGRDGLRGCEALQGRGARILVQDEASSVVWGMPGLVARAGLADRILPLREIGPEIVRTTSLRMAMRR